MESIKEIFFNARELPDSQRQTYLDQACNGSDNVRAEVEALLSLDSESGDFLAQRDSPPPPQEQPGAVIGRYKLLQLIGEGGMGCVFMVEQQSPVRRKAAMKIIKLGMDTRRVIARFQAERQVLAMMDHPNIARVFDAGETEAGRPYFVMELVEGIPITRFCDENRMPVASRLRLFLAVCAAVQHAHQNGVIHRDIKPGNVLVILRDDSPLPKLIDFGIAKATQTRSSEGTVLTEIQQLMGTPAYMSPEQTASNAAGIDTRCDIYSLGVVLYELLTGTTPFDAHELESASHLELQRMIAEADPPRPTARLIALGDRLLQIAADRSVDPRRLRLLVKGDLDCIIMKAMEKDRTRRYQSASELARDIVRYLDGRPIEARPPGKIYLAGKLIRRHRAFALTAAIVCLLMTAWSLTYARNLRRERLTISAALKEAQARRVEAEQGRVQADRATARALAAESEANANLVRSALAQARAGRTSSSPGRRFESLAALAAAARIGPIGPLRDEAIGCLPLVDMRVVKQYRGSDRAICINHAGTLYADADANGNVVVRRFAQQVDQPGETVLRLPGPVVGQRAIFSPDDRLIAMSLADGHVGVFSLDGKNVLKVDGGPACDFMPDTSGIAVAKLDGPVVIWDLRTAVPGKRLDCKAGDSMSVSPDGSKLATWHYYSSKQVVIGDFNAGTWTSLALPDRVMHVAWHPNSVRLAVAVVDGNIYQYDASRTGIGSIWSLFWTNPQPLSTLTGHYHNVWDVEFNHGGDVLASTSWDGTRRLWDAVSGRLLLRDFNQGQLSFSSDDRQLTIANDAGVHLVAEIATGRERRTILAPPFVRDREVSFSPDGLIVACGGWNVIRFWDLDGFAPCLASVDLPMEGQVRSMFFDTTGRVVASTDSGLWRLSIRRSATAGPSSGNLAIPPFQIEPAQKFLDLPASGDGKIQASRDGRRMAVAQYGQKPLIWNADDPANPTRLAGSRATAYIAISPDGKYVATGVWNQKDGTPEVVVWDGSTGRRLQVLPVHLEANVAFSPDGHWLVTGSRDAYQFWEGEADSWKPRHRIARSVTGAGAIVFSPDSRMLALSPGVFGATLFDAATGAAIATIDDGTSVPVGFSPDGGKLVISCRDGTLQIWDLRVVRQELAELGLNWSDPPRKKE